MSVEAKIKAANLRKLGSDFVSLSTASLDPVATILKGISVGFPGFSVLGLPLTVEHEVVKNQLSDNISDAKDAMSDYNVALIDTASTWAAADDSSTPTVTY